MKANKYKIKTNKKLVENATKTLDLCRELYNAALQERRDAWKREQTSISYSLQQDQLPSIKMDRPDLKDVHSQVLQDVLRRVERAFDGFFSRVEKGQTPGYPRFKTQRDIILLLIHKVVLISKAIGSRCQKSVPLGFAYQD